MQLSYTLQGLQPFNDEPNYASWKDESTGLYCMIRRTGLGHLCGYVGVTIKSPLYGLDYDHFLVNDLSVHGGVTFAGKWSHTPKWIWWIGFDCGHARDLSPFVSFGFPGGIYRDWNYVMNEVKELMEQIAQIKKGIN